ncbi:hypothetical protein GCM10009779_71790 [Polymorphospora rubra]
MELQRYSASPPDREAVVRQLRGWLVRLRGCGWPGAVLLTLVLIVALFDYRSIV